MIYESDSINILHYQNLFAVFEFYCRSWGMYALYIEASHGRSKRRQTSEEVEVTSEMIEAGVDAYFMFQRNWVEEELVRQVYLVLCRAKSTLRCLEQKS